MALIFAWPARRPATAEGVGHVAKVVLRSDAVENSTSAHHQVWVERGHVCDVGLGYASVDAQHHFPAIDQLPGRLHATGRTGDKLLPAPAGVYGQQQDKV